MIDGRVEFGDRHVLVGGVRRADRPRSEQQRRAPCGQERMSVVQGNTAASKPGTVVS
jgi:hypothetical protein